MAITKFRIPACIAVLLLFTLLSTTGCGKQPQSNSAVSESSSAALVPANSELAAIYNRSCRSCHTVAATGAPLTGDSAAWAERQDKGMDILLDNVVNGFGGMPPFGLCMDCDAQQLEELIRFMAQGK